MSERLSSKERAVLRSTFTAEHQPQYRVIEIKEGQQTIVLAYEEIDELREWLGKVLPAHEPQPAASKESLYERFVSIWHDLMDSPNKHTLRYTKAGELLKEADSTIERMQRVTEQLRMSIGELIGEKAELSAALCSAHEPHAGRDTGILHDALVHIASHMWDGQACAKFASERLREYRASGPSQPPRSVLAADAAACLFDGNAVWQETKTNNPYMTAHDVAAVLDAVVRLIRHSETEGDSCADPEAPCASHMALERAETALRTCAAYMANRNRGDHDGFNAACSAVEEYFDVAGVHEAAPSETKSGE